LGTTFSLFKSWGWHFRTAWHTSDGSVAKCNTVFTFKMCLGDLKITELALRGPVGHMDAIACVDLCHLRVVSVK